MLLYVCTCIWQSSSPPINCSQACEDVESANVPLHHFDETSLVLRDVGVCDGLSGVTIAPRVLIQLHAEMLCAIVIHLISYLMVRFSIRHAVILFVEYCDFFRLSGGKWVVLIYSLISPDAVLSKSAWRGEHLLLSAVPWIKSHESQAELAKVSWLNLLYSLGSEMIEESHKFSSSLYCQQPLGTCGCVDHPLSGRASACPWRCPLLTPLPLQTPSVSCPDF